MKMRLILASFCAICFIAFISVLAGSTYAACNSTYTISDYKKNADMVVVGNVVNKLQGYSIVLIEKYYKGEGPNALRVNGNEPGLPGETADLALTEGKKYLLFLKNSNTGIYSTNQCKGSKLIQGNLTEDEMYKLTKVEVQPVARATIAPSGKSSPGNKFNYTFVIVPAAFVIGGVLVFFSFRFKHKLQ